jgi:hypothetical protein
MMTGLTEFGAFFDKSGLPLTDAQKATLFQAWPMLKAMIALATAPMPREAEPSAVFRPEVQ